MKRIHLICTIIVAACLFQSCEKDDPKPVNEEELITTLTLVLETGHPADRVTLRFFDEDGEHGSTPPEISVEGALKAGKEYRALMELLNETATPVEDITEEIAAEADDHLFCFSVNGDITIRYEDEDSNGLPIGLVTTWVPGSAGSASVTILLRHQHDTKTGTCPGGGETDVEVTFELVIEEQ